MDAHVVGIGKALVASRCALVGAIAARELPFGNVRSPTFALRAPAGKARRGLFGSVQPIRVRQEIPEQSLPICELLPAFRFNERRDGLCAVSLHVCDFQQGETADTPRWLVEKTIRVSHVPFECGVQSRHRMLVEADEQRRRIRRAANLIEEGVQKGVRDHVESEGRLAHLADSAAPCRRVLGGVVRMQAEAHFQLVDGFGRQPGDEDLVKATPGPVMPLETPDAFLDGESDAHGVGHRAEAGERRQIAIGLVVGEAERNLVRHLPTSGRALDLRSRRSRRAA